MSSDVELFEEFSRQKAAEIQRISTDPELWKIAQSHATRRKCISDVLRAITPHAQELAQELGVTASAASELLLRQFSHCSVVIDDIRTIEQG
jgi:hypothetical protein